MIRAKSTPEGASVYLDGKVTTATQGTLAGITPGTHNLKIIKEGFVPWEKDVEVFPKLVTDITAVLVSQTPRLEPLTNTGAAYPSVSPSLSKLAYFSENGNTPGVWVIPLTHSGLSLFKATPTVVLKDSKITKYSQGLDILWAPEEKELVVEDANNVHYIVDLTTNTAQSTASPELIENEWLETLKQQRITFTESLDIPEDIKKAATSPDAQWSPDEKKFLYQIQIDDKIEYRIYNMEKPLPVGENVETIVFTTNINDKQPKVSWYADSYHLILVEMAATEDNKGSISLLRIDGTNKTEIYNNTLYSDIAYSAPGGDKIIILTSFKSTNVPDLYTIGIR